MAEVHGVLVTLGRVRTAFYGAGAAALVIAGVAQLVGERAYGLAYLACATAQAIFVTRRGVPALVGALLIGDGLIGGRAWEGVAGLVAVALAAVPGVRAQDMPAARDQPGARAPEAGEIHYQLRCLGQLRIEGEVGDLTSWLLQRPIAAYVWCYLLALRVADGASRVTRDRLAQAVYPHGDERSSDTTLRKRLSEFVPQLPGPLAGSIGVSGRVVESDFEQISIDALDALQLRDEITKSKDLLNPAEADRVRLRLQAIGWGEFLPDWGEIDARLGGIRGQADDLITHARLNLDRARSDIALSLARSLMAQARVAQAVAILEVAAEHCPDREDLMTALVAALLADGQPARATALQAAYSTSEVN